jgi:hypothetical protein
MIEQPDQIAALQVQVEEAGRPRAALDSADIILPYMGQAN